MSTMGIFDHSEVRWSDSLPYTDDAGYRVQHLMRRIAASTAKILSFAITVFFLGPQFGSLDIDGDGVPDVPVMVLHVSNNQNVQPSPSDRHAKFGLETSSPFVGPMCDGLGLMKARIVDDPRAYRRDPIVPLRC